MPDEHLPAPVLGPAADDGLHGFAHEEVAAARRYRNASRAESTRRKYARDWRDFAAWCRDRGHDSLPASPAVVAVYLSHDADRGCAPPTVNRKLAAIGHHRRLAGLVAPQKADGGTVVLLARQQPWPAHCLA